MDTIKRSNTKDEVEVIIKHEIISGNIPAGTCITQNDIADALGLSRMPIREAFNVLVQDGFLQKLPNRKILVSKITPYTIDVYSQILSSIESEFLSRLTINQAAKSDELFGCFVKNQKKLSDINELKHWHFMLSDLCNDDFLSKMHINIKSSFFLYSINNFPHDLELQNSFLSQLYDAISASEVDTNKIKQIITRMNMVILEPMRKCFSDES